MALSNWDTFMMNEKGEPIEGYWESPKGVGVQIYKNWIHIHDKKVWKEGDHSCVEPIVMIIENGFLDYKDIHVLALRGPQNGVFIVSWIDMYSDDCKNHKVIGAIGAGVYAFADNGECIGITKKSLKWFHEELKKDCYYYVPNLFRKMKLIGMRYNQGDMYFSNKMDIPLQATQPGKAKETIMSKAIKSMEK